MDEMEKIETETPASEETQSVSETVSSEAVGKKNKKSPKAKYPFWKRLLIFLLGTTIGFVSCIGAIVGVGVWTYSNASLQKLDEMGIHVALPESLQGTGTVDISTYTIKTLVDDILYYTDASHKEELTIHALREKYGLNLLADVEGFLPEKLATLPLGALGEDGVLDTILSAVDISTILGLLPEGTFSEPMLDALKGKEFTGVGDLFADVKLGYLLGSTYEKQGEEWVLVPADPNHKTLIDYLSDMNVGDLISTDGEKDLLGVMKEKMSDVPLTDVFGIPADGASMFAGVYFGDIIVLNEETGTYSMDFASAFDDLTFGSMAGYELRDGKWYDAEDKEATVLMARLFSYTLGDFATGEFSIDSVLEGLTVGELMGYTKKKDNSYVDEDGNKVTGLNAILAEASLGDMLDGNLAFDTLFKDEKVGTILNYTQDGRGRWFDKDGTLVEGLNASIANITMNQFFGNESLDAVEVFSGVYLGEIMGFTVASYKTDGTTPDTWNDADGKLVEGFDAEIASVKVGSLSDGDGVDFKEIFGDELIGDMQGHTYNSAEDQWYDANHEALGALENAIAKMTVGEILDGKIDFAEAFGEEKIGDLQGYTYYGGKWYEDEARTTPLGSLENAIAGWTLKAVMDGDIDYKESLKDAYIGEFLGYKGVKGNWKDENGVKVTGLGSVIADLQFGDLESNDRMTDCIQKATVADLLGYEKRGGVWKDKDGKDLTKILSLLAETKLSNMNTTIDNWQLGDLMGFEKRAGSWVDPDGKPDGVVLRFADLKVADLSNNDKIHETIDGLKMYELLGYTKESDGKWYHNGDRVTGVMAYLASHSVEELSAEIDRMTVADALGYQKVGDVWKDENGKPISALMASFADTTIKDFNTRAETLTMAEMLGYKKVGNAWKDENGKTASAFVAALADTKVNDLSARAETLTIAGILGYKKEGDVWKDENGKKVSALMAAIADTTVDNLAVRAETLIVADILGYKKVGNVWKDENGKAASSFVAALADAKLGDIGMRVDSLKLSEVFENTDDGFFKVLGGDTKLIDLDSRVDELFGNGEGAATIGDFMDAGIVEALTEEEAQKLGKRIGADWQSLPVAKFIDRVIDVIISVPFFD